MLDPAAIALADLRDIFDDPEIPDLATAIEQVRVLVATGHGRDAIGIDLDARNFELARERVGPMFLPEPEFVGEPFQFPKVEDVQTDAEVL